MELEMLRNDLLTVINHYGKTIPIGTMFYVVKDVAHEVDLAYQQWLDMKKAEETKEPEPAQTVEE